MIIKEDKQNSESFIDGIAKHLSAPRAWALESPALARKSESVIFGAGFWTAEIVLDGDLMVGLRLANSEYDDSDIAVVEEAICMLEGFSYEEDGASENGDESEGD